MIRLSRAPISSPSIPMAEKVDLKSIQCEFESHLGHVKILTEEELAEKIRDSLHFWDKVPIEDQIRIHHEMMTTGRASLKMKSEVLMELAAEQKLHQLYHRYEATRQIPIVKLRENANHFVPGVGPLNPDIMLIGEAPGKDEDRVGEPFVGRAGEVLDTLITRAELKRPDIFITNLVKYRPINEFKKNRIPSLSEVKVSRPYLKEEIAIVKPNVIGLMGKPAIQTFFPLHTPATAHGTVYYHGDDAPIVFLFHPAVAAYNPSRIDILIEDFKVLVTELNKL